MIAGGIGSLSYGLSETSDSLFGVNPLKSFIVDTLGFSEDTYHLFGLVSGMASMAGIEAYGPFANSGAQPSKAPQKSNNNSSNPNKGTGNATKGVLVESPVKYDSDMFGKPISNRTQSIIDKFDNAKNILVEDANRKQSVIISARSGQSGTFTQFEDWSNWIPGR